VPDFSELKVLSHIRQHFPVAKASRHTWLAHSLNGATVDARESSDKSKQPEAAEEPHYLGHRETGSRPAIRLTPRIPLCSQEIS
jgi:hypothetical protein